LSHIRMSHVTHMNASCHTYEWFMSHIWMSHVTHTNESCHTYERVMSYVWMSHVPHMTKTTLTINKFIVWYTRSMRGYTHTSWHKHHQPPSRPTQEIMYVHFLVNRFEESILLIVQYKYLKSGPKDFIRKDLILRTRLCENGFVSQHCWVVDFHLINRMRRKCFVQKVSAPKGHLPQSVNLRSTVIFKVET